MRDAATLEPAGQVAWRPRPNPLRRRDLGACEAAYWVGHELGSTFGLQECTATSPVDCHYSSMEVFPPAEAPNLGIPYLMQTQISTLANSGFVFAQ